MALIEKFKTSSQNLVNITKEQFDKSYDYAKIKSDSVKEKIDFKIQEKAIINLKAELAMRHKSFDDYTDEEIEVMLTAQKQKIKDTMKNTTLVGALAVLGLDFLV